jgi:hypothetical protein
MTHACIALFSELYKGASQMQSTMLQGIWNVCVPEEEVEAAGADICKVGDSAHMTQCQSSETANTSSSLGRCTVAPLPITDLLTYTYTLAEYNSFR